MLLYWSIFKVFHCISFRTKKYGDLVNWNTAKWEVLNMAEYEASYDQICKHDLGLVMFPGHWNITQAITLCKNVKGEINVIKDANNNAQIREFLLKNDICKGIIPSPCPMPITYPWNCAIYQGKITDIHIELVKITKHKCNLM